MESANNYFKEISDIIAQARNRAEVAVNSELVMLYWNVVKVIKTQILEGNKPEYGKNVIAQLSQDLVSEYGRGYGQRNLFQMVKFYEVFNDEQILHTLCAKLTWSHFRKLITLKTPMEIDFYATLAINERWSVRELEGRMGTLLYERTALSKKPEITIANDLQKLRDEKAMSTDLVLRDPYVLDFLDLKDNFNEKDLESAILAELERFIFEMGRDFTFAGRQVRLTFDSRDYFNSCHFVSSVLDNFSEPVKTEGGERYFGNIIKTKIKTKIAATPLGAAAIFSLFSTLYHAPFPICSDNKTAAA